MLPWHEAIYTHVGVPFIRGAMWKLIYLDNMNFNTELKKNIGCNIVYSSSDGGNYSIILMEFDSGNRIMTYCYWEVQKDGKWIATSEDDITAVMVWWHEQFDFSRVKRLWILK